MACPFCCAVPNWDRIDCRIKIITLSVEQKEIAKLKLFPSTGSGHVLESQARRIFDFAELSSYFAAVFLISAIK